MMTFSFAQSVSSLRRSSAGALAGAAPAIVQAVCAGILAGVAPTGEGQRQNAESTRGRKQRDLGHSIPLVGEGRTLSNPGMWRVETVDEGTSIALPADRRVAVERLRAMGYLIGGVPASAWLVIEDLARSALAKRGQ